MCCELRLCIFCDVLSVYAAFLVCVEFVWCLYVVCMCVVFGSVMCMWSVSAIVMCVWCLECIF